VRSSIAEPDGLLTPRAIRSSWRQLFKGKGALPRLARCTTGDESRPHQQSAAAGLGPGGLRARDLCRGLAGEKIRPGRWVGPEAKRKRLVQWILNPRAVHFRGNALCPNTSDGSGGGPERMWAACGFCSQAVTDCRQNGSRRPKVGKTLTGTGEGLPLEVAGGMNPPRMSDEALDGRDGEQVEQALRRSSTSLPNGRTGNASCGPGRKEGPSFEWYIGRKAINGLGCFGPVPRYSRFGRL